MHANRRTFLAATAATAASAALGGTALAAAGHDAELATLFDAMFETGLERRPEGATLLGLDTGARAGLRARLTDESAAGVEAARVLARRQLAELERVDRARLSPDARVDLEAVAYTRRSAVALAAFPYGGGGYGPSPYVVSQQTGAYQTVPDFMDTKQPVASAADADAYVARVRAFARQLDDQTERLRRDADQGVIPPVFIVDTTIGQLEKAAEPAERSLVVGSLARRSAAAGLDARHGREAARVWSSDVLPALGRQLAAMRALRARATEDAGAWKLPRGDAFYAAALQANTTTRYSPEEVHRIGQEQATALRSRMDALLRQQGLTRGSVAERVAELQRRPGQRFPDTDAGKADAIAYCNARQDAIRAALPRMFRRLPPYAFEVRRVPVATQDGAANAFAQSPSLDGKRPGLVYFNLKSADDWPRMSLTTTVYHEGLPGHQLEGGLALSNTRLPLIRKSIGFSGYAEGWALYAEDLADELGMYADDPAGRVGYLKAQLFRADRLIVDTGLHHLRWSREKAVRHFVESEGEAEGRIVREVDRYCVNPGQACSYKLGHLVITGLRADAQKRLGTRFDVRAFHDMVLGHGRVPLETLQGVGADWLRSQAV